MGYNANIADIGEEKGEKEKRKDLLGKGSASHVKKLSLRKKRVSSRGLGGFIKGRE